MKLLSMFLVSPALAFTRSWARHATSFRVADIDYPSDSDYATDDSNFVQDAYVVRSLDDLKESLLSIAAFTSRGEAASREEKEAGRNLVNQIEEMNTSEELAKGTEGTWELVWSDTQLFRSSPFFMAGRAVCTTMEQARQYDWFCDMHRAALAISNIQRVRQVISSTKVVSEFEVSAGAVPFLENLPFMKGYGGGLPVAVTGAIVSTADIESITEDGSGLQLLMDTVEIKGSNIPGLRQALDSGVKLQSRNLGSALENAFPDRYDNPRPVFMTTYLDEKLRISRDQDGKVFVYTKVSPSTDPTDYSSTKADLGVGNLVSEFASAFLP